jgi:DNA-binding beta-propeller fold protein YncE
MMQKFFKIAVLFLLFSACSDEPVETVFFDLDTENGIFIACEGNFMYGNGSLSFYNPESQKVINQLFYARNNAPLGDVVQSLSLFRNQLFIVVNNSGKIYVVDAETAKYKGAVTGLTSPRHIHFISDEKAYVSDLYSTQITIIHPVTLEITGKIDLEDHTSEQMVQVGKYLFVSSWADDENIVVIDTETDELIEIIKVPYQPKDLEVDKNGKIWVLSEGDYESIDKNQVPALSRIDPATFTIEQIYRFEPGARPACLDMNPTSDTLYFLNSGVYKMPVDSRHLPDSVFISSKNKLFYNLSVNPGNNEIYVTDAIDYTQNAMIYRYSGNAEMIDSFRVGINPSDFLFR